MFGSQMYGPQTRPTSSGRNVDLNTEDVKKIGLLNFDYNNQFTNSEYRVVVTEVIKQLTDNIENKAIGESIDNGIKSIEQFTTRISNLFRLIRGKSKNNYYQHIENFLKDTFHNEIQSKIKKEQKKRKYSKIFNPFYFIMVYQLLKSVSDKGNKKFKINIESIDKLKKGSNLDFKIDSSTVSGGRSDQGSNSFIENCWKIFDSLLEMLYGKYIDKNPKSIVENKRPEMIKYSYYFCIFVIETFHSLDDIALHGDCSYEIKNFENKKFLTNIFNISQQQFQQEQRGGSRKKRKSQYKCETFQENTSTITQLLNGKDKNTLTTLLHYFFYSIEEDKTLLGEDDTNKLNVHSAEFKNKLAKILTKYITHIPTLKKDDIKNSEIILYKCDPSDFYIKILKLYVNIAEYILHILKSNLEARKVASTSQLSAKEKEVQNKIKQLVSRIDRIKKVDQRQIHY